MQSEWKEVCLGDIADINMGQSPKGDDCNKTMCGIPLLNGPTEFGDFYPLPVQWTTDVRKVCDIGDILFCVRGSTTGRMNIADQKYAIGRGIAAIRHKTNKKCTRFIKAILDIKLSKILSSATGSTFPNVGKDLLNSIIINLPTNIEQLSISQLLSSFDDKIILNNSINDYLEQMTQTIFKSWFVDFEPFQNGFDSSEWPEVCVGDVVNGANTGGDAIQKTPMVDYDTGIKCVRVGDLSNKRRIDGWGFCKTDDDSFKKYKLEKGDIVITRTATLGLNQLITQDLQAVYNNGLIRLKHNSKKINSIFLYRVLNTKNYYDYISCIEGETSVRPNMKINYPGYALDEPVRQHAQKFISN